MENNVFKARLAKRVVMVGMAGILLDPNAQCTPTVDPVVSGGETLVGNDFQVPLDAYEESMPYSYTYSIRLNTEFTDWTDALEKEFRKLALEELKGTIDAERSIRLNFLNARRDQLCNPRPPEDVILQMKRDRVLAKVEAALREYVEFYESSDKKGTASKKAN